MENLAHEKPGLVTMRQTKERFGVFAVQGFCGHKILGSYDRSYVYPVFDLTHLHEETFVDYRTLKDLPLGRADQDKDANDVFRYIYAVCHSPSYRSRYVEFLKIDFPRLPLTQNVEMFSLLVRLGGELAALHLMESPKLDKYVTQFVGGKNPAIEQVSWSSNTVWIDKAQTNGFKGVPESVWNFNIGGYQVCEKWLKDRKGRTLSKDDIAHYQKIVVALNETIRLMKEIDEVIEKHGGWPGAFTESKSS